MNEGRTVFAQLTELLPRRAFDNAVARYRGDQRVRSLTCMDQLLCMIFAQVTGRSSLRETVSCLTALCQVTPMVRFRRLRSPMLHHSTTPALEGCFSHESGGEGGSEAGVAGPAAVFKLSKSGIVLLGPSEIPDSALRFGGFPKRKESLEN